MKENKKTDIKKSVLSSKFEMSPIEDKFLELENIDDLWYFIKSSVASWVAGSTK